MGIDVTAQLIYGFKILLSKAFELNLINPGIMDEDDWQLISDEDNRDEIIETHVKSETLKIILQSGRWNILILTSTQEDSNPSESYLFIYDKKNDLVRGGQPDYVTGVVDIQYYLNSIEHHDIEKRLKEKYPQLEDVKYNIHWIVETSW